MTGSRRGWWVVSAMRPDVKLDGPYETRDAAQTAALKRADPWTAVRALAARRMPYVYQVRQFEMPQSAESGAAHYKRTQAPVTASAPQQARTLSGLLPPLVYTYTRGALLTLCEALKLPPPPEHSNRSEILEHMEQHLRMLGKE